jgi:DUF1365 family protein
MSGARALNSAVYEGTVRHWRRSPRRHAFAYRIAQLCLDLDELEQVFAGRWLWSFRGRNLAEFRRSDYLAPASLPLAEAARALVERETGVRPTGAVRLLTHLRYAGYVFNPVSFYYCHDGAGALEAIIAEITNTPWNERHAYVLPIAGAQRRGALWQWDLQKTFHVSPFLPLERRYLWRLSAPEERLRVHMSVRRGAQAELAAQLDLIRRPLTSASLARVLWRYPLMSSQVIGAIYWQALRLWLKRTPVYGHPQHSSRLRGSL